MASTYIFACKSLVFGFLVSAAIACSSEAPSGGSGTGAVAGSFAGMGVTGGVSGAGVTGGTSGVGVVAGIGGGVGGMGVTGGVSGAAAVTGGMGGVAGMVAGMGGMAGTAGMGPDAGMMEPDAGGMMGAGDCCPDGNCLCHGPAPTSLSGADGPYTSADYDLAGIGCVYYPTDAEPPFAAVAIADGFGGAGGCGRTQTSGWGPFYASHGIVAMIVETTGGDQPAVRGARLSEGIEGFKAENANSSSPLFEKLAGRYGTSGFSMGGGGTTFAASDDSTLLTSVGLMAWGPTGNGVTVPTLFICGSTDRTAACGSHSENAYGQMPDTTSKAIVMVSSGHVGQPTAASGMSGAHAIAFQKVYLEGDERWRDVLMGADFQESTLE